MHRRYENYLIKKYEPLYRQHALPMTQTCMCWGFEVDDGWFNIINTLSSFLCRDWLRAKFDYDQIKDRLGELRFRGGEETAFNWRITEDEITKAKEKMEQEYNKTPVAVQVKEKYGGLRFYANNCDERDNACIGFAETLSEKTCEVCGKPGKLNHTGWIKCLCKDHRRK